MSHKTAIDLVSYDSKRDAHVLIAVEQEPWPSGSSNDHLRHLQERLFDYVDIAVDGFLAAKYPELQGKNVIIRLDCYDVPREECEKFFLRFADHVHMSAEIQMAIKQQGHIKDLGFEFNWGEIKSAS